MGGAHSPPRRGGVAEGRGGQFGKTLRQSDHPVCAALVASRHSFDGAATPPLRGGEYPQADRPGSFYRFVFSVRSKNSAIAVIDVFQCRHSSESWTSSGRTNSSTFTPFASSLRSRSTV